MTTQPTKADLTASLRASMKMLYALQSDLAKIGFGKYTSQGFIVPSHIHGPKVDAWKLADTAFRNAFYDAIDANVITGSPTSFEFIV